MGYTTHKRNRHLALQKRERQGLVPVGEATDRNDQSPSSKFQVPEGFGGAGSFLLFIQKGQRGKRLITRAGRNEKRDNVVLVIHRLLHEVFPAWSESRVQVMSELMYDNLAEKDRAWLADSLEKESVETNLDDLGLGDLPEDLDDGVPW